MKSHYGTKHSQRMNNLFIGMNEVLKHEKRDSLFDMQSSCAAELMQARHGYSTYAGEQYQPPGKPKQ